MEGDELKILKNRVRVKTARALNSAALAISGWAGSPRHLPKKEATQPPRRVQTSEEWYFSRWQGAFLTQVAPEHLVRIPQKGETSAERLNFGWKSEFILIPPVFTLELPHARIVGRHGAIVTNDQFLLRDLSRQFSREAGDHSLLHEPKLRKVRNLKGRYAAIGGPGNSTYHWLYDLITKFEVLRLAGYELSDFDGFIMPPPKFDALWTAMRLIGIPEEKILSSTTTRHYQCEELVAPSFTNSRHFHHPFIYPFFHKLLGLGKEDQLGQKRRRIYISRRDAAEGRRRIVNENEVLALLEQFGFQEVVLSELSFEEQAKVFSTAEFIVSPHGGGLAHLCFAEAPLKVIEIFAPDYMPLFFYAICIQRGFDYEPLLAAADPAPTDSKNGGNILVNLPSLERLLCRMLTER